jgi:hypothetical protein
MYKSVKDLKKLKPNQLALYWYLKSTGQAQTIDEIITNSGLPRSSVYQAIKKNPEIFTKDKIRVLFNE